MSSDEFNSATIQAEYQRLGYRHGWTFMATPASTLQKAEVALVGLNPGGGGPTDTYAYGGLWDSPTGNAYFTGRWGPNNTETPIQGQVRAWHALMNLSAEAALCAQFVPFRSPNWASLGRKAEALTFSEELWRWALQVSPASLFVTMGKLPAAYLVRLLEAKLIATLPTGWLPQTIDVYDSPVGRRIVALPHPSRYRLFGRAGEASSIAEESFRLATDRSG